MAGVLHSVLTKRRYTLAPTRGGAAAGHTLLGVMVRLGLGLVGDVVLLLAADCGCFIQLILAPAQPALHSVQEPMAILLHVPAQRHTKVVRYFQLKSPWSGATHMHYSMSLSVTLPELKARPRDWTVTRPSVLFQA